MSAPAAPVSTDRSDFRTVMLGGTKLGLAVGVGVVLFLALARLVPAGSPREIAQTLVVLVGGVAASFLPSLWVAARTGEGIAGAAALGLWGTVVFSAFDIVLLRPFRAYPWTWDALGGNSTWWYLPIWWMLGTLVAWLGAIVAARAPEASLVRLGLPSVAGGVLGGVAGALLGVALPAAAGAGFVIVLAGRALVALARKG
ncbi:MAG TPA: hypothetical protein VNI61_03150 [Gemmatimonadales bacterium]|nr:hypothetical protein [Gemmatimonadales bacterium]